MTDVQIPTLENHQSFVVEALLAHLQRAGWRIVKVTQALNDKPPYVVSTQAAALEIILVSDIAELEFDHWRCGNQVVRLDVGAGIGPTMFSEWNKLPAFDSLISAFVAELPSRMLQEIPDLELDSVQLRVKYEEAGEHGQFTKADWKAEVEADNTLRGYWDWVQASVESVEHESVPA
jgi:hypothetical protein